MSFKLPNEREFVENLLQAFKDEKMILSFERPFRDRRGKWTFNFKPKQDFFKTSIISSILLGVAQLNEAKEKIK